MGDLRSRLGPGRAGAWLAVTLALMLGGCSSAPDVRREGALTAFEPVVPRVVPARLTVPATVGIARVVDGRVTAVPADERARWMGAAHQVNRNLLATLHLVPMPPVGPVPPLDDGTPDTETAVGRVLEMARLSRLDAVLFYELSARAEGDRPLAWLTEIPLFGGIVPRTVATEGHGTAIALLVDPVTLGAYGYATARMADQELTSIRLSHGRPDAVRELADYALLHTLVPRAEDLLTTALSGP